ncbi:unnamed protein product [Brachionus calyciflorus]|uniref:Uncharacterized protein n=1 Tax=Brachionus calyciflorus TaxID=104777 RepID=A0A813W318_9BILA|nr:unnamed protein product [Brachionus calyciflorus]
MDKFSLEQLLAAETTGEVDSMKVKDILDSIPDGVEKFNQQIEEIIKKNDEEEEISVLKTASMIDESLRQDIRTYSKKESKDGFPEEIKKNLEAFYSVQYCPSYLMHKKLLSVEDFEYLLEIYCDLHSVNKEGNKEVARKLQEIMDEYIEKTFEKCKGGMSIEELHEMLGY